MPASSGVAHRSRFSTSMPTSFHLQTAQVTSPSQWDKLNCGPVPPATRGLPCTPISNAQVFHLERPGLWRDRASGSGSTLWLNEIAVPVECRLCMPILAGVSKNQHPRVRACASVPDRVPKESQDGPEAHRTASHNGRLRSERFSQGV